MRDCWIRSSLAALACLATATACGTARVSPGYVNSGSLSFAQAVMNKGPMLVRIYGSPYAVGETALERRIEDEMARGIPWLAGARFSTDPAEAVGGPFYVSLIFNTNYVGAGQCALTEPSGGSPSPDGAVQVSAAFCDGADQLGTVAGALPQSSGPDDPQFATLIQQTTQALFPTQSFPPRGIGVQIGGGGGGVGVGIGF
jgi:hypothetical protein